MFQIRTGKGPIPALRRDPLESVTRGWASKWRPCSALRAPTGVSWEAGELSVLVPSDVEDPVGTGVVGPLLVPKNERSALHADDGRARFGPWAMRRRPFIEQCYLVDPASSHMLVSKIKPCMSQYMPN